MIPLDLDDDKVQTFDKNKFKTFMSLERDFTKTNLSTCYMAIFSSFITDLACLYIPLIQYTDQSITEGFLLFVQSKENKVSVFYICDLVYLLVFYTGTLLTLFWENHLVWDILRNWVNVGILLTLLSLPFNRKNFLFKLATSLINMVCLRIRFEMKFFDL